MCHQCVVIFEKNAQTVTKLQYLIQKSFFDLSENFKFFLLNETLYQGQGYAKNIQTKTSQISYITTGNSVVSHGAQIGVWGFPHNQNNHGLSSAYVTCI